MVSCEVVESMKGIFESSPVLFTMCFWDDDLSNAKAWNSISSSLPSTNKSKRLNPNKKKFTIHKQNKPNKYLRYSIHHLMQVEGVDCRWFSTTIRRLRNYYHKEERVCHLTAQWSHEELPSSCHFKSVTCLLVFTLTWEIPVSCKWFLLNCECCKCQWHG